VTVRNISRRPSPSPRVCTDEGRSLVRWRHNQIFSAWWVTNFSYPWCFADGDDHDRIRFRQHIFAFILEFMDELCKPCELLKVPAVQISETLLPTETARLFTSYDPGSWFTLVRVKAMEGYFMKTVTEFNTSVIVVTKMITHKFLRVALHRMHDRSHLAMVFFT